MDDIKIAKFETMIRNINNLIKKEMGLIRAWRTSLGIGVNKNYSLSMIYDYDKLNEYGKIIMQNAKIRLTSGGDGNLDVWASKYEIRENLKKPTVRIAAAEDFAKCCRENENKTEGYKFIFWALMILTVDKTNAEEHLSMICDFSKMLQISDDELEDIVTIIERIYNKNKVFYHYKTDVIPCVLGTACDCGIK